MKNLIYIFFLQVLFFSCSQPKEKKEQKQLFTKMELKTISEELNIDEISNENLKDWIKYYKTLKPTFSLKQFDHYSTDSITNLNGTIYGNFDKNFDPVYSDFLVYKLDRKQYLDFDSYQWSVDENKHISFSPDQEIDLVDIENKTVKRIGFRGTSQWVENAFWKDDSTIILLENSYEKYPIISVLNLKNRIVNSFRYKESLPIESKYSELRIKKKIF